MVSISGIRGIVGKSLTPEVIIKYVSAYAEFCKRKSIVIGRDGRITGKPISDIVISTLLQMGCDVIDLGVCPTPTVGFAVEKLKARGGISITASHNPIVWNGLKFFSTDGLFLDINQNRKLWKLASQNHKYVPWNKFGKYRNKSEFINVHVKEALKTPYINAQKIRRAKFKVVIDCINSAGGIIVPYLLEELGCKIIELNCELSGIFKHKPEPLPENLTSLCQAVRKYKADFGIAVDPDVDRLVLIDENGNPYGEEYTIVTCIKYVLEKKLKRKLYSEENAPPKVVVNLSTTRAVDDVCQQYGAIVLRTPVGEINVAKKMKEVKAIIGGEGSGGVILPDLHYNRDAIIGSALILQYLSEFGGTISELKSTLPKYSIVKEKLDVSRLNIDSIFKKIESKYSNQGKVNTEDGLKIDFENSWIHLRKSNTEPIIRIIAEAPTKYEAKQLVKKIKSEIFG